MTSIRDITGGLEVKIPAGIDATTPEQQELYRAAAEFERFFVSHLMKQMQSATDALSKIGEDEQAVGGSAPQAYQDMVQDQMTQSVLDGGGLGLAAMLYEQIQGPASPASGDDEGGEVAAA